MIRLYNHTAYHHRSPWPSAGDGSVIRLYGVYFCGQRYAGGRGDSGEETCAPMYARFRNRYRIASARLPGWDYRAEGLYFVTVCTAGKMPLLGAYDGDGGVCLSALGHLAASVWHRLPVLHAGVALDALAVLPDHLHALVRLDAEALCSLGTLVQQAKGAVTKTARRYGLAHAPVWQERFYDRIVRSDAEAMAVYRYVRDNARRHTVETDQ